jgi:senataxin
MAKHFDVVIIDEAAQAVEPSVMVPLVMGCKQVGVLPRWCEGVAACASTLLHQGPPSGMQHEMQGLQCVTTCNQAPGAVLQGQCLPDMVHCVNNRLPLGCSVQRSMMTRTAVRACM